MHPTPSSPRLTHYSGYLQHSHSSSSRSAVLSALSRRSIVHIVQLPYHRGLLRLSNRSDSLGLHSSTRL